MVAVNFTGKWTGLESRAEQRKRVFELIRSGQKIRTTRKLSRYWLDRVGKGTKLQLYWGMRTGECEKILDVVCREILPVEVCVVWGDYDELLSKPLRIIVADVKARWNPDVLTKKVLDSETYAVEDGFDSADSFFGFFAPGSYVSIEWLRSC